MDDADVATTNGVGRRQRCAAWQTVAVGGLAWQPREAAATVDGGGRPRGREQATAVVGGLVGGGPRRARGRGACAGRRSWARGAWGGRGVGWAATGGGYRRRGAGAGRGRHDGVGGDCSVEREEDRRKRFACSPAAVNSNNSRRLGGAADRSYLIAAG
jgi:hypothetical protein